MHENDEILHETFQPIDWCPVCNYTFIKGTGVQLIHIFVCSQACADVRKKEVNMELRVAHGVKGYRRCDHCQKAYKTTESKRWRGAFMCSDNCEREYRLRVLEKQRMRQRKVSMEASRTLRKAFRPRKGCSVSLRPAVRFATIECSQALFPEPEYSAPRHHHAAALQDQTVERYRP